MQGGSYLRGSHSLKGVEEGKAGRLRAPWPRKAFCGPGKGHCGAFGSRSIPQVEIKADRRGRWFTQEAACCRKGGRGCLKGRGRPRPPPLNLDRFQPLLPFLAKQIWGFRRASATGGAQNLDRFQPLLEGGRPLLAGGSGSRLSGSAKHG